MTRNIELRCNFQQRQQYKISLGNARMRNIQSRLIDHAQAIREYIEVQRARPPANRRRSLATVQPLDFLKTRQQRAGLDPGEYDSHGIDIVRLVRRPHRRIPVQTGRRHKLCLLERLYVRQRVADEIKTTFASHYTAEISLTEALDPKILNAYGRQATGEKYLINPQK